MGTSTTTMKERSKMHSHATEEAQSDSDYDYVANLYTKIAGIGSLETAHGFKRHTEDMVGTLYYEIDETTLLYINPCVGVYLAGEALKDNQDIQVSLLDIGTNNNNLISDYLIEFKLSFDLDKDAAEYARNVNQVLAMVKYFKK